MADDQRRRDPAKDGLMPDSQSDDARGIPEKRDVRTGADDRPTPAPGDPGKTPGPPASGISGEPTDT